MKSASRGDGRNSGSAKVSDELKKQVSESLTDGSDLEIDHHKLKIKIEV